MVSLNYKFSYTHDHTWCHKKSTMYTCYGPLWRGTYMPSLILPCATHDIVRHGVATRVTATQGTCLGKYLTAPYSKNAMKQFFS